MPPMTTPQVKAAITAVIEALTTLDTDELEMSTGPLYQTPAGRRDSKRRK